jgi:hypothetical protein
MDGKLFFGGKGSLYDKVVGGRLERGLNGFFNQKKRKPNFEPEE